MLRIHANQAPQEEDKFITQVAGIVLAINQPDVDAIQVIGDIRLASHP